MFNTFQESSDVNFLHLLFSIIIMVIMEKNMYNLKYVIISLIFRTINIFNFKGFSTGKHGHVFLSPLDEYHFS